MYVFTDASSAYLLGCVSKLSGSREARVDMGTAYIINQQAVTSSDGWLTEQ